MAPSRPMRTCGGTTGLEVYVAGPLVQDWLSLQAHARRFDRGETRVEFPAQDRSVDRQRTMGQLPTAGSITTGGGRLTFTPGVRHEAYAGADVTRQVYDNGFGQLGQIKRSAEHLGGSAKGLPRRSANSSPTR